MAQILSDQIRAISWNVGATREVDDLLNWPWKTRDCHVYHSKCRFYQVVNSLSIMASSSPETAIIGLQGISPENLKEVQGLLRGGWHVAGEQTRNPILYRSTLLKLDSAYATQMSKKSPQQMLNIARFTILKTQNSFIVANTQLSKDAGLRSDEVSGVLCRFDSAFPGYIQHGLIWMGSFNELPEAESSKMIIEKGLTDIWTSEATKSRVNGPSTQINVSTTEEIGRTDYIWLGYNTKNNLVPKRIKVWDNRADDLVISEHRPVVADITVVGLPGKAKSQRW